MANIITIQFKTDFEKFRQELNDIEKIHLPYAARRALFGTAKSVQARITAELPQIFRKVTPFTARSVQFWGPTKKGDPLTSRVFIKGIQAAYLNREEIGGSRTPSDNTSKPDAKALILPNKALLADPHTQNLYRGAIAALRNQMAADLKARRRIIRAVLSAKFKARARHSNDPAERFAALKGVQSRFQNMRPATGVIYLQANEVPSRFASIGGYFKRDDQGGKHGLRRLTNYQSSVRYTPKFEFNERYAKYTSEEFARRLREEMIKALQNGHG